MLYDVEKLKLWVHKVLPLVYDDSLSYYEVLAKTVQKLNEVIQLTSDQNEYLEQWLANTDNALNDWKEQTGNDIAEWERTVNADIVQWKGEVEARLNTDLQNAIIALQNEFDDELEAAENAADNANSYAENAAEYAERAENAAATAAEDAVDSVMPTLRNEFDEVYAPITAVGSPLVATLASQMTDTNKVYVYAGSETGMTNGDWYYYDGTDWVSGGVYNAVAVVTDPTLTQSGVPADAKATGDEIGDLKSANEKLIEIPGDSLIALTDFTDNDNTTSSVDAEHQTITVTTTASKKYACVQTADTWVQANLAPSATYRLHAKLEKLSGNPSVAVLFRGVSGNDYGTQQPNLRLEDGESGYVDVTITGYTTRVTLMITGATAANASVKFSEIWIKPLVGGINGNIQATYNNTSGDYDLNNVVEDGTHLFAAGTTYTHEPTDSNTEGGKCLIVETKGNYVRQTWIRSNASTYRVFFRIKSGGGAGTWSSWLKVYGTDTPARCTYNYSSGEHDLNDCTSNGTYVFAAGTTYAHEPTDSATNGGKCLIVDSIPTNTGYNAIRQTWIRANNTTFRIFYRNRAGNSAMTWTSWFKAYDSAWLENVKPSNISDSYDGTMSTSSQGANVGEKIKVMSYNAANYRNDTTTYISADKQLNLKKMLSDIQPDFIGMQEDRQYIDSGNTRSALTAIYNPIFPYDTFGYNAAVSIRSKSQPISSGSVGFSNGRWLVYATFTVNSRTLLLGSVHMVAGYNSTAIDSADSIAARLTQYTELRQWLNGDITLNALQGGAATSCPSWDWCVICGDYNTITATDKTNLQTQAAAGDFILANGGWLGWLKTEFTTTNSGLDNIMVSNNVIIDSVTAHSELYDSLYSDHVPFEATLTLLES